LGALITRKTKAVTTAVHVVQQYPSAQFVSKVIVAKTLFRDAFAKKQQLQYPLRSSELGPALRERCLSSKCFGIGLSCVNSYPKLFNTFMLMSDKMAKDEAASP
jgi:hypothetical protein